MAEEIDALRQQLVLAGKYGQSLMIENNELKDRSKEDELELNALRLQVQKLEDLNNKIIRESNDDLDSAQKENVDRIAVLEREAASNKAEIIDLKTAKTRIRTELDEAHNIHQLEVQSLKKIIDALKTEAKMDRQNVTEDNTEEMEQIIKDLKLTNQELQTKKDERDIALKMAMNKITNLQENENQLKTDIKTSNAQREHLQSEKNTLEQELVKSQETLDDLQLELQQARMINTAPAENIEGQGNSLFSEVEDQRKKTASELNILTSTYKDKIAKFDTMEAEIEKLRNENTNLKFQLSSMVVSENQNNRLISELRALREERDTLLSCGYKAEPVKDSKPELSSLQKENDELKQKIGAIYLTKNIQHDTVRRLDSQLKVLEKHNNDLRDQLKEARLNQYRNLEYDSTSTQVQNENIPPTSKSLPKVKQITRQEASEYPSDENHRELIQQFEKDYPAEDCKTQ